MTCLIIGLAVFCRTCYKHDDYITLRSKFSYKAVLVHLFNQVRPPVRHIAYMRWSVSPVNSGPQLNNIQYLGWWNYYWFKLINMKLNHFSYLIIFFIKRTNQQTAITHHADVIIKFLRRLLIETPYWTKLAKGAVVFLVIGRQL